MLRRWSEKAHREWSASEVADWLSSSAETAGAAFSMRVACIDGTDLDSLTVDMLAQAPVALPRRVAERVVDAVAFLKRLESATQTLDVDALLAGSGLSPSPSAASQSPTTPPPASAAALRARTSSRSLAPTASTAAAAAAPTTADLLSLLGAAAADVPVPPPQQPQVKRTATWAALQREAADISRMQQGMFASAQPQPPLRVQPPPPLQQQQQPTQQSQPRLSPWSSAASVVDPKPAARGYSSPWGRSPVVQETTNPDVPAPPVPSQPAPIAPDLTPVPAPEPIKLAAAAAVVPEQKPAQQPTSAASEPAASTPTDGAVGWDDLDSELSEALQAVSKAASIRPQAIDIPPPPGPPPPVVDIPPPAGPPPPIVQQPQKWTHSHSGSDLPEVQAKMKPVNPDRTELARMSAIAAWRSRELAAAASSSSPTDSRRRAQSGSFPKPRPQSQHVPSGAVASSDKPPSTDQTPSPGESSHALGREGSIAFRRMRNPERDSVVVDKLLLTKITDDMMLGTRSTSFTSEAALRGPAQAHSPIAASTDSERQQQQQDAASRSAAAAAAQSSPTPSRSGLRGMFSGLRTKLRGNTPSPAIPDSPASPLRSRRTRATVALRAENSSPELTRRAGVPRAMSQTLEGERNGGYHPRMPELNECHGDADLVAIKIHEMAGHAWDSPDLVDYWTSAIIPAEQWTPVPEEQAQHPPAQSLVDFACVAAGYNVEVCWDSVSHALPAEAFKGLQVLLSEEEYPYYREFIAGTPHENYVSPDGPVVVSIQLPAKANGALCKVIVRTKKDDRRALLPFDKRHKLLKVYFPALKDVKLTLSKTPRVIDELRTFEEGQRPARAFKIGVLYVKPNQTDENEIYSNVEADTSKAYRDFLAFLGEKVQLQGWTKYRAGLDVTDNNTGTHSVYTQFRQYEIMFHVATMLPFQEHDTQKVERKRHIGNDVVVIVWKEQADENDRFNPAILTSHFIHCCFVVNAVLDANGETTHYNLTVSNKAGVSPYPPFIPQSSRFEKAEAFREFLLTKLINAERIALGSPEFQSLTTARKLRLGHICQVAMENK